MDEHVDALARGLLSLGVSRGDRVAVYSQNNSSYAALQWATAKIGALLTTINPAYTTSELIGALKAVGCRVLFVAPLMKRTDVLSSLLKELPSLASSSPQTLQIPELPELKTLVLIDNISGRTGHASTFARTLDGVKAAVDYRDLLVRDRGVEDAVAKAGDSLSPDDVVNLQFTSGTTGRPKAVSLTHFNLVNNGMHIGDCMRLTPRDILCNVPPLFHCFGLVLGNLAAWTHGASVVYPSEGFDPVATLRSISEERCTTLHGVATMFISELAVLDRHDSGEHVQGLSHLDLDFSSLRTGIAAGSPVPDEVMRKIMKRLNLTEQTIAYGQTETSPVTFQTATDDPLEKRVTTVGRIMPHVRARIVDPSSDRCPSAPSLPLNTPGELVVSGYPLQKGYWENEEETNKVMRTDEEGVRWLWTGDICKMDEEGYLSVVGRSKDVIIRGGENLFPVTIENTILTLEGVADASVVGTPDAFFGETVGVFVKRRSDPAGRALSPDRIVAHMRAHISHQNSPSHIWFLGEQGVEEEYPLTASGKIRKVELREWAKGLSGRGVGKVVVIASKAM